MIVKTGREYIIENGFKIDSITKIVFGDSDKVSEETDKDINSLKLITESSTTISTTDKSETAKYYYYEYDKDEDGNDIKTDSDGKPIDPTKKTIDKPCTFTVKKDDNKFLFEIKLYKCEIIEGDPPIKISCMGLFNTDENNKDTLIARVVFPPIYKKNETELVFNYKLYF